MMRFMYKTGMRELRAMVMNRKIDNDWTNDGTTVPKEKKQKEPKTPADV